MFSCTCCSPPKTFSAQKSVYRHARKTNPELPDPRIAVALTRRAAYDAAPRLCECCETPLTYQQVTADQSRKYCSRSCAASMNGVLFPKRDRLRPVHCWCGTELGESAKRFCSNKCQGDYKFIFETKPRVEAGDANNPQTIRNYMLRTKAYACEVCSLGEWQNKPIPLDVDHIDGDHTNNLPSNLRLICLNCHGQTETYKSRNKGNGRHSRRQRYGEGKSW